MSWIQDLYDTYENSLSQVGYSGMPGQRPLLPICHITAQAQIEITIDGNGNFRRARLITDKHESTTIIPCTEESGSRAGSRPKGHPLCDKLQYVAGDFLDFGGVVTSGFAKEPEQPFVTFVQGLTDWCESDFSHPKIRAVLDYVSKRSVIRDLVAQQILIFDPDGKFARKGDVEKKKGTKNIFDLVNPQYNAFVRWRVEIPGDPKTALWKDKTVWNSWINYYLSTKQRRPLCYVTGEPAILATTHPKYIRREGDGAKIISSNDTSGFTFRGRFLEDEQVCNVSLEVTQKAHYALAWLISRQGYYKNDLAIVAWAISGAPVPQPTDDSWTLMYGDVLDEEPSGASLAQDVAIRLKKRIAGYSKELGDTTSVVVMGLDSASPGRLSITFYRKLTGADFLKRIDNWHESFAWIHNYRFVDGKRVVFVGAPSPSDMAEAIYGTNENGRFRVDDRLRKTTMQRLLPCIVDGQSVPRDIIETAVRRTTNKLPLEDWQWEKSLSIACSLFRGYNQKENYTMSLDPERKTRDYLYGRLLALADNLESWALREAREGRETNAMRLMQRFAEHPYSTWRQIELSLRPYIARLGGKSINLQRRIDEVVDLFNIEDFIKDTRLSGEFLLGYHSQREFLRRNRSQKDDQVKLDANTTN